MTAPAVLTFEGRRFHAARLLAALHNGTQPLGLGRLHARGDLTVEEAEQLLQERKEFWVDYLFGRPIKVRASADGRIHENSRWLYDRDAGEGAFDRALAQAELSDE
jgi:hypothetical protein